MTVSAAEFVETFAGRGAPPEILQLADDTIRTLAMIENADVGGKCLVDRTTAACSTALGAAIREYDQLGSLLAGWAIHAG